MSKKVRSAKGVMVDFEELITRASRKPSRKTEFKSAQVKERYDDIAEKRVVGFIPPAETEAVATEIKMKRPKNKSTASDVSEPEDD